ncbi:MAG: FkbM family methyltransferase [Verrucomicrobia bacterium]|nr:FkbM family methyltransferase [Verrucomicrobiota bacterium]
MLSRSFNEHPIWKRRVHIFDRSFRAPSLDRLASLWLHKFGILGKHELKILARLIRRGMTVIDAGANQGLFTLYLADLVCPGRVFALEPEPRLYRQLVSNVRDNSAENVDCYQIALSDSAGSLTLVPGGLNLGDNRIIVDQEERRKKISVKAATLDELVPAEKIDFLKMDIQGWEAKALVGARKMLERNPDLILMFEFWPCGLAKAGADPDAILRGLEERGFGLWRVRTAGSSDWKGTKSPTQRNSLPIII